MKLTGNSLLAITLSLTSLSAFSVDTPELTTFTAGTPAKAAEVNANFEAVKNYSTAIESEIKASIEGNITTITTEIDSLKSDLKTLQEKLVLFETNKAEQSDLATLQSELTALTEKVSALEAANADPYNIPVYGDCVDECDDSELIGYTSFVPNLNYERLVIKTEYGFLTPYYIDSTTFNLQPFNIQDGNKQGSSYIHYLNSDCSGNEVAALTGYSYLLTRVKNTVDNTNFVKVQNPELTETHIRIIKAGTEFHLIDDNTQLFYKNSDGNCTLQEHWSGGHYVEIYKHEDLELSLKSVYSTLHIDGYVSH